MHYATGIVYKLTIPVHIVLKPLQPLDGPYSISNLQNLQFETPEMVYGLTYQFKVIYIYSTSPLFLWKQVGIIFHILTGICRFCRFCSIYPRSCKMMFPISYLVYSVNYFTCLLITYLVYSENYHVCLLITTRTNQSGEYNR